MSGRRRIAAVLFVGAILWLGGLVLWATRPLDDNVPVGTNFNLTPPREVSQHISCNTVFAPSARSEGPLPQLATQPATAVDAQPLGYQREPCVLVQDQARVLFALNGVVVAALVGLAAVLAFRGRPAPPALAPA